MNPRKPLLSLLLIVGLVSCTGDATDDEQGQPTGWNELASGPLEPREAAHGFWVDSEVLIVGGSDAPPCPPQADCVSPDVPSLRDGAVFDVATGEWRSIASAPVPIGAASGLVSGDGVYLWVHGFEARPGTETAFLSYHVAEDRWEELVLPEPVPEFVNLAKAGDHLVLYQHTQEKGVDGDLLFDPDTQTWAELPPDPLQPSYDRSMVWTDSGLVLVGIKLDSLNPSGPNFYSAAKYDPATETWTELPDSEVLGWSPIWYPTGSEIVNPSVGSADGGDVNNWGQAYPFGGVLDVNADGWEPLPDPPDQSADFSGYTAASSALLLSYEGWILNYPERAWTAPPTPPNGYPHGATVVITDKELITWGGVIWDEANGQLLDTGWQYNLGN